VSAYVANRVMASEPAIWPFPMLMPTRRYNGVSTNRVFAASVSASRCAAASASCKKPWPPVPTPLHLTLVFNIDHTNAMAYANAARNLLSGSAERALLSVARNEHKGAVRVRLPG
jgi:hypothetical protein